MRIAIEGCAHGELEKIYATIAALEADSEKVDLLLCCGDFQATRNTGDLNCMAIPKKFHDMCSFHKYYSGELVAPILTVFIGGNHEASNYMQELPYGGWVAPNIYYMGYAGCVQVNGVRIAGLSGIFKGYNYHRGHHEIAPYDENSKKSVYHVRQLDVFRLKQLSGPLDICLSHDWPRGVYNFGNAEQLCRFKPHFRDEIADNRLGSGPAEELLHELRPAHWFAAHLHCKFAAIVPHRGAPTSTRFLALDKCLPQRRFLQLLDIAAERPTTETTTEAAAAAAPALRPVLSYDLEWLTILHRTNHLLSVKATTHYMPGLGGNERHDFTPTAAERDLVLQKMNNNLVIPANFARTAAPYDPAERASNQQPAAQLNAQTTELCERLGLDDPVSLVMLMQGKQLNYSTYKDVLLTVDAHQAEIPIDEGTSDAGSAVRERTAFVLPEPQQQQENPDQLELDDDEPESPVLEETNRQAELALLEPEKIEAIKTAERDEKRSDESQMVVSIEPVGEIMDVDSARVSVNDSAESMPPRKVFKRRNEAIYATPQDE